MGLLWAAAGAAAGGLIARAPGVDSDLPLPLIFGPLGFIVGIIFSGILVMVGSRRGFERISRAHFTGWGAASGLLLSSALVIAAAVRGDNILKEFLLFGPGLAIAGAVCAAGSLALARRAERQELSDGSGDAAQAHLVDDKRKKLLDRGQ